MSNCHIPTTPAHTLVHSAEAVGRSSVVRRVSEWLGIFDTKGDEPTEAPLPASPAKPAAELPEDRRGKLAAIFDQFVVPNPAGDATNVPAVDLLSLGVARQSNAGALKRRLWSVERNNKLLQEVRVSR